MALITIDEINEYYGIDADDQDTQDVLTSLADRVSDMAETYCNRVFLSADYTEYHDGQGTNKLFPRQTPITTVSGIYDDTSWVWDTAIDSDSYMINNDSNMIILKSGVFSAGDQNIKLVYTGGYTTIPGDLKQAVIEEVIRKYKSRRSIDVTAVSLDDGSTTHTTKDLLPQTIMVLNKYKLRYIN